MVSSLDSVRYGNVLPLRCLQFPEGSRVSENPKYHQGYACDSNVDDICPHICKRETVDHDVADSKGVLCIRQY